MLHRRNRVVTLLFEKFQQLLLPEKSDESRKQITSISEYLENNSNIITLKPTECVGCCIVCEGTVFIFFYVRIV